MKKRVYFLFLFGIIFSLIFVQAGVNQMFFEKDSEQKENTSNNPAISSEENKSQKENILKNVIKNNESNEIKKDLSFFDFFSKLFSFFKSNSSLEDLNETNKSFLETNLTEKNESFLEESSSKRSWIQTIIDFILGRTKNYSEENITNFSVEKYQCGNLICEINLGESIENCVKDCI